MKIENDIIQATRKDVFVFICLLFLSFYLPSLYINLGFALKPYMIFTVLIFIFHSRTINISKLYTFEIFMLIFYMYYSFTIIFSKYQIESSRLFIGVYVNLFAYFVLRDRLSKLNIKELDKIISITGIIYNLISLLLYIYAIFKIGFENTAYMGDVFGALVDGGMFRLIGLHYDPNFYILSNLLFFFFFLTKKDQMLSKLGMFLTFITMILTISRSGYIVILVGIIFLIMSSDSLNKRKLFGSLILTVSIFFLIDMKFFSGKVLDFIYLRFDPTIVDITGGRSNLWTQALALLNINPLFGTGLYTSASLNERYFGRYKNLHNSYLDVLVESGLIGILLLIVFMLSFYPAIKNTMKNRHTIFIALTIILSFIHINTLTAITNEFLFLNIAVFSAYYNKIKSY